MRAEVTIASARTITLTESRDFVVSNKELETLDRNLIAIAFARPTADRLTLIHFAFHPRAIIIDA